MFVAVILTSHDQYWWCNCTRAVLCGSKLNLWVTMQSEHQHISHTFLAFTSWSKHQGIAAHKALNHTTALKELLYLASQRSLGLAHVAEIDDTVSKSGAVSVHALRSADI